MGLLDDLQQEAARRKASEDEGVRKKAERETLYRGEVEPAMDRLHEYLVKLTQHLGFLKPKTQSRYPIPGYGDIVGVVVPEFDLKVSTQPYSREITLNFACAVSSEDSPTVEVLGSVKIKAVSAQFQKHRLAGLQSSKKDANGEMSSAVFNARGKIPMQVHCAADMESGQIKMTFTNFDDLGSVTKVFAPSQLTEQMLDELGRFIAREQSGLMREALPDQVRQQLRAKIQQDMMKRKWEAQVIAQQEAERQRLAQESSIKTKVLKQVDGIGKKITSGSWLASLKKLVKRGDGS